MWTEHSPVHFSHISSDCLVDALHTQLCLIPPALCPSWPAGEGGAGVNATDESTQRKKATLVGLAAIILCLVPEQGGLHCIQGTRVSVSTHMGVQPLEDPTLRAVPHPRSSLYCSQRQIPSPTRSNSAILGLQRGALFHMLMSLKISHSL